MCEPARMIAYQKSWTQVKLAYAGGFMVSERGLQAVLYSALQAHLPGIDIVVEPTWEMVGGGILRPDLVLVERGEITDIFEIKFVPHGHVRWRGDIARLHNYVGNPNAQYPVRLAPQTGQWAPPLRVQAGCCLHFVVVANEEAEAMWPPLPGINGIKHWFGRVGGAGGWGIE